MKYASLNKSKKLWRRLYTPDSPYVISISRFSVPLLVSFTREHHSCQIWIIALIFPDIISMKMVTTWILPQCELFQLNKVRSTLLYHSLIRVLINASSFISTPQDEIMHMRLNYWAWHLFLKQTLSNMFAASLGNK